MKYTTKIAGMYEDCPEVAEYMELRKRVFVDRLSWDIPTWEQYEFDQYDTAKTVYVLALRDSKVVAGGRLIRTDSQMPGSIYGKNPYTYMIADACDGLLDGMPTNLCDEEPPRDPKVWEFSRIISSKHDGAAVREVFYAANNYICDQGGVRGVFIGSPALMRMCKMSGFDPKPMGPIVSTQDAGRFLAFQCNSLAS